MKHCTFCGEPVREGNWDYVGAGRVWLCDKAECVQDARDAARQAHEEAQYAAEQDGYERYMR